MRAGKQRIRLTVKGIAAAKPRGTEYTLWDTQLAHFGVRVQPSGVKSFIIQTRVNERMRKITLGRFPELPLHAARREGAAVLVRLWGGEDVTPPRKKKALLFRDFAQRYRERRRHRWKPSSLKTYDGYLRHRLMPHFGRLRLDAIDHTRVSAWFDAASAHKPGAPNRAFEILRAMLKTARQWGELGEHVPDACANIVRNPRKPVARFLTRQELQRLGTVLHTHKAQHPWPVAAIRLLTLTGARLSEILNLKWEDIGEPGEDGASVRLEDSKTGPRTLWLGQEASSVLAALPRAEEATRVFPETLTSSRLYTFWVGIREEAGLPGLRIHDCRHTWASQGVMNGVGLTTVGRLLGHRQRDTTAIYAHLDDATLKDAAAQPAAVIARAMGYKAGLSSVIDEAEVADTLATMPESPTPRGPAA
ncbi:MAG: site-specific integrase [Bryobacterales bacterium]|nr:site-specific integrase [Bryobacterales bacterium]